MTQFSRKGWVAIYDAIDLLKRQGFYTLKSYGEPTPPDILAVRRGEYLLLMVRQSRSPIPDAEILALLYYEDLIRFRKYADNSTLFRLECWVHSPPDGWSYYEVLPGGIRKISHDWLIIRKEERMDAGMDMGGDTLPRKSLRSSGVKGHG